MKLLNIETQVTRYAIRKISLNIEDFTSVRLPTQGMTKLPSSNETERHHVSLLLPVKVIRLNMS
jgi:hypothetical protein